MDLIPSFSVDHNRIVPGIYISRVDVLGDQKVTTYDVRVTKPNVEPCINVAAMHSLEHLIATFLRNDPVWKDEVIYWGPMGCLTGFYLILKGNRKPREIFDLLLASFKSVEDAEVVPGTEPVNCGDTRQLSAADGDKRNICVCGGLSAGFGELFRFAGSENAVGKDEEIAGAHPIVGGDPVHDIFYAGNFGTVFK